MYINGENIWVKLQPGGISIFTIQIEPVMNRIRLAAFSQKYQKLIINQFLNHQDFQLYRSSFSPSFVHWIYEGVSFGVRFKKHDDAERIILTGDFITLNSDDVSTRIMMGEHQKRYFDYLPDEILIYIFSFLRPIDAVQCSLVCYQWYSLFQDQLLRDILISKREETNRTPSLFETLRLLLQNARPMIFSDDSGSWSDGDWD